MITLRSNALTARILPFGATLAGLWYRGHAASLVIGSPDASAYRGPLRYSGAIIGPVANRISGAAVDVDATLYKMEANDGANCLHSGASGLHAQEWRVTHRSVAAVSLRCDLADGANGLPGNRRFDVHYSLTDDGVLFLEMTARSDRTTVVNLAHHPYWNLGPGDTIKDHHLMVRADTYLPVDPQTLPVGDRARVANTPYDFRTFRSIPTDQKLDASVCLAQGPRRHPAPAARLSAPSGLLLEISTTEPGLQIYNGSGLKDAEIPLYDQRVLRSFSGIALEPQGWPDAPRHRDFPSIVLRAGQTYRQTTTYHIWRELDEIATV